MDISEIISNAKEKKGLTAESALELFDSGEDLSFAERIRRSAFSSATTISVGLDYAPENTLAGLKLRAGDLAAIGHRRVLLKIDDPGDHDLVEAIDSLLSIERKRDDIRRVDLKLALGNDRSDKNDEDEKILAALKNSDVASVILPADADSPLLAKSIGIPDIGLYANFTADECLIQLESLLRRADEISPRIVYIAHEDALPPEIFLRICQIIRVAKPETSIMIDFSGDFSDLDLVKYVNSFCLVSDEKLDKFVNKMIRGGQLPSFCAACKLEDRTGETFLADCKSGKMHNCCYLNALISLKEYLSDFGSQDSRIVGTDMILRELYSIKNDEIRKIMVKTMKEIHSGERGSRV